MHNNKHGATSDEGGHSLKTSIIRVAAPQLPDHRYPHRHKVSQAVVVGTMLMAAAANASGKVSEEEATHHHCGNAKSHQEIQLGGPLLIVLGGVGPHASVHFEKILLQHTASDGTDQSYLPTIHVSLPECIEDRTSFLKFDNGLKNPGIAVANIVNSIGSSAQILSPGQPTHFVVPCNTFHAPQIYDAMVSRLGDEVRPVHMLQETVSHILHHYASITTIGVLSTTGTRELRLYHNLLEANNLQVVQVPDDVQEDLHATIYDPERGIKACGKTPWSTSRIEEYASLCIDQGAEILILGCTELPLALVGDSFHGVPLIDPMVCGARALIRATYPKQLRPLDSTPMRFERASTNKSSHTDKRAGIHDAELSTVDIAGNKLDAAS